MSTEPAALEQLELFKVEVGGEVTADNRPYVKPPQSADYVRGWLKRGGTSPDWVWWLFRLYTCPCGERFRQRNDLFAHELQCPVDRAYNGQG